MTIQSSQRSPSLFRLLHRFLPVPGLTLLSVALLAGCESSQKQLHPTPRAGTPPQVQSALRVGVAPGYPPLAFEQDGAVAGAEIDMARALGKELNRTVQFVTLDFDDLINSLLDGRSDIIMSGMSVTRVRQLRANFADPYLQNQLRAIFRRSDVDRYRSTNDILGTTSRVGVLPGTTGDIFVQRNCPYATRVALQNRRDIGFWLTDGGKIDLYVDDIFALAQIVSQNEASVASLKEPLATEDLAWAIAPANDQLRQQVNQILARWKTDGTLDGILLHWMPYLKDLKKQ